MLVRAGKFVTSLPRKVNTGVRKAAVEFLISRPEELTDRITFAIAASLRTVPLSGSKRVYSQHIAKCVHTGIMQDLTSGGIEEIMESYAKTLGQDAAQSVLAILTGAVAQPAQRELRKFGLPSQTGQHHADANRKHFNRFDLHVPGVQSILPVEQITTSFFESLSTAYGTVVTTIARTVLQLGPVQRHILAQVEASLFQSFHENDIPFPQPVCSENRHFKPEFDYYY
jgi:hypothetical protein